MGKLTDDKLARIKILSSYFLFYEETEFQIIVLAIWDALQDPEKLKLG